MHIQLVDSDSQLSQILELQKQNHVTEISAETKKTEGFVTVRHDLPLLQTMNNSARQIIALENETVIGYALVMPKELKLRIPVLLPMFEMFGKISYKQKKLSEWNYYVMGQVCIAEAFRGKGVFEKLYAFHRETYSSIFNLCVTEVSTSNQRSMRAHEKVGFQIVHTFADATDEWNILIWDWK
jgi:hypothetical protein